jgi:3-hydroxyisobutyrate dehydrogenase
VAGSHARPRLGWVGAGRIGTAMAARLAAAGNDVAVWNRTPSKAAALAADGATIVETIDELADRDTVFIAVSDSEDFEEVTACLLRHPDSVPAIIVDHSTVSAESSARVRTAAQERGCMLLAAPVSGNPDVIAAGQGSLVISGPRAAFEALEPQLLQIAHSAVHIGEAEQARVVKLAHQAFLCGLFATLVEVTTLAEKEGVSRATFLDFINGSALGSRFTKAKTSALVNREYTPTFTMRLLGKDIRLALAEGRRLEVPLSMVALVHEHVQAALGNGLDEVDFAALLEVQASNAGIGLSPLNGT